jgi:uncharacterized membrane protein
MSIGLGFLSVTGLLISLLFTLIAMNVLPSNHHLLPQFCRLEPTACASILSTNYARLLRLPNFVAGIFFYLFILIVAVLPHQHETLLPVAVAVSFLAVAVSLYLLHALIVKLRTHCPLCYASHAINVLILLFLVLS